MIIKRQLFRLEPAAGPEAYKTYGLTAPIKTHTRPGTCGEVECRNYLQGFKIVADISTELGRQQANYIRLHSGRHFTVEENVDLVTFIFPPGQVCFEEHRVSLQREPNFFIKGGDHRGNPLGLPTRRLGSTQWRDDFGEHQEGIIDAQKRG